MNRKDASNKISLNDLRKKMSMDGTEQQKKMTQLKAVRILESMQYTVKDMQATPRSMVAAEMAMERALQQVDDAEEANQIRRQMATVLLAATIHASCMDSLKGEDKWESGELESVGEMVVGLSMQIAGEFTEQMDTIFSGALNNQDDPLYAMAMAMQFADKAERNTMFGDSSEEKMSLFNKIRKAITEQSVVLGIEACIACAHAALEASDKLKKAMDEDLSEDNVRSMLETIALSLNLE